MHEYEPSRPATRLAEIRSTLREFQRETILLVLPGLYVVGVILLVTARSFQDPLHGGWPAEILFLLPLVVLALRKPNYLASAWALVLGCLAVDLLVVMWANVHAAVYLLALPVGLATLFISVAGGALTATLCTLLLVCTPVVPVSDPALRATALIGMWGTVGLIWLTLRPFSNAMRWYSFSYEQNRGLLEQARDSRVQLKQTLEDLADANLQLTRLNRLAQGLRQDAERARKAKQEFVANVSHELRTPLNMIVGFSEMIMQTPNIYGRDIPQDLLADLDVILRNSQHLSKLIDDVLDLSQIEAERVALTRERVSLCEIVEAAALAVRPLFDSKELYLKVDVPTGLPAVLCDPTRIRQVVLNLLSNAGRFTERGGVQLRAWQEGECITVSVADTGPGIAPEAEDKIFRPFQQLDGSIRRQYGGSGLGLSISKRFIELHGGEIWFESRGSGGTCFFFRLPIDPPLPAEGDISRWFSPYLQYERRTRLSMAPVPVVHPRFLVLESGHVLQRLLTRYLDGAEIVPVGSLPEAIQELSKVPARALLVNDLSVSRAFQRLNESREVPYGTPVVLCSISGIHKAIGELGVSDYLIKPILQDTLLAALDRLGLASGTVLIVDDEPEAVRLFRRMLVSSGRSYRVLSATDGQQALHILQQERPDVVLLDLVMPNVDGFQLLEAMDRDPKLRDLSVVVISARDPAGQPIVSNALTITQRGGLSLHQLLACIDVATRVLSPIDRPGDPARIEEASDLQAC
jgi:signal transduction histidine kinase/DNA-binding response OmpR family regulator